MDQYLFGAVSGMVGLTMSHPFDTIKSNIQSNVKVHTKQLMNIKYLYKGYFPPLVGMCFEKSLVFGTFFNVKQALP